MLRVLKWAVLIGVAIFLYRTYPSAEHMAAYRECSSDAYAKVKRTFGDDVFNAQPTFAGYLLVDLTDKCEKARVR